MTTDNDNDIFLQLGDAESEAVATVVLSPAAALGSDSMDSMVQFFFYCMHCLDLIFSTWTLYGCCRLDGHGGVTLQAAQSLVAEPVTTVESKRWRHHGHVASWKSAMYHIDLHSTTVLP